VPGTLSVPMNGSFTTWMGWFAPYAADFYLIGDAATIDTAVRDLAMIGLDRIAGWFDTTAISDWASTSSRPLSQVPQIGVDDLTESLNHHAVTLIDVRNANEWAVGHIAGAIHIPLGRLGERFAEIPQGKPIVMQCAGGARSLIGASVLKARGVDRVINLVGGFGAWVKAGQPVEN